MINHCKLNIKFEFGAVNNQYMNLLIKQDDKEPIAITPVEPELSIDIQLPTKINMVFSGKNYNSDTVVDQKGCIISDKYVKICSIALDNFELNELFLHQTMKLFTDHEKTITASYIGFNGTVTLDFNQQDVFSQILTLNK